MINPSEHKILLELLKHHSESKTQITLNWIRITITILTPSLVLLIGLQDDLQSSECLLHILLVISILLLTLSILTGLLILQQEYTPHQKALEEITELLKSHQQETLMNLPFFAEPSLIVKILMKVFPILVWLSILSLGTFGILKYI